MAPLLLLLGLLALARGALAQQPFNTTTYGLFVPAFFDT